MSAQSPDTSPPNTDTSHHTLKEAAELVGRSTKTILRWCRDGAIPGASKIPGPKGDEWSIPAEGIARVAEEKGLHLTLPDTVQTVSTQDDRTQDDLLAALGTVADLREEVGHLSGQADHLKRTSERLGSDLDHLQAEHERQSHELATSEKSRAVAEARTEEVRSQLELARRDLDQERSRIEAVEKQRVDLEEELVSMGERSTQLESERAEALSEAREAVDSMGWWSKRRWERRGRHQ